MNRSSFRPAHLVSRILGYTRRAEIPSTAAGDADRWENEGGHLAGSSTPVTAPLPPRRGGPTPRVVSRRSFTLLLFGATAFIVVLSLVTAEPASLTLLPATFVILFVLTVASLRRP